jgi:hypothetical protein
MDTGGRCIVVYPLELTQPGHFRHPTRVTQGHDHDVFSHLLPRCGDAIHGAPAASQLDGVLFYHNPTERTMAAAYPWILLPYSEPGAHLPLKSKTVRTLPLCTEPSGCPK